MAPAHRFHGVSKAMLAFLEAELKARGITLGRLTSTTTAHAFYQAAGWHDTGPPDPNHAVTGYPMTKALVAPIALQ